MKVAFFLLFVGLLAVQATNFRLTHAPKIIEIDEIADFEYFKPSSLAHTASKIGHKAAHIVHQVGHEAGHVAQTVGNAAISAAGFKDATNAWGRVNWKTGKGMTHAIQLTAKDCQHLYHELNKLTGGRLNGMALNYAAGVAAETFPPAAIAIEAGKVVFRAAHQVHDITQLTKKIHSDIHNHNWVDLAENAFKLFKIIYDDLK